MAVGLLIGAMGSSPRQSGFQREIAMALLGPILGIESSCDETAAAVLSRDGAVLSNVVSSQVSVHEKFGGVVPELAARAHLGKIDIVVQEARRRSRVKKYARCYGRHPRTWIGWSALGGRELRQGLELWLGHSDHWR